MSGVIDEYGQWEHCNVCNDFVLIQNLEYEPPSEEYEYGRMIGPCCIGLPKEEQDEIIRVTTAAWREQQLAHYKELGWKVRVSEDGGIEILETKPLGKRLTVVTHNEDGSVTKEVVDI